MQKTIASLKKLEVYFGSGNPGLSADVQREHRRGRYDVKLLLKTLGWMTTERESLRVFNAQRTKRSQSKWTRS